MVIFETHPNIYTVYFASRYYPTAFDMNKDWPIGIVINTIETPEDLMKEGYETLDAVDIPINARNIIMACASVLYEATQYKLRQLQYDAKK